MIAALQTETGYSNLLSLDKSIATLLSLGILLHPSSLSHKWTVLFLCLRSSHKITKNKITLANKKELPYLWSMESFSAHLCQGNWNLQRPVVAGKRYATKVLPWNDGSSPFNSAQPLTTLGSISRSKRSRNLAIALKSSVKTFWDISTRRCSITRRKTATCSSCLIDFIHFFFVFSSDFDLSPRLLVFAPLQRCFNSCPR